MIAILQRVKEGKVILSSSSRSSAISSGIVALVGIEKDDGYDDIKYIANKMLNLRIFEGENGRLNRSLLDIDGELLVIPNFTIAGVVRKGNKPSFDRSAGFDVADRLYRELLDYLRSIYPKVYEGFFGEKMEVFILNDGPVTIIVDSKKRL